MIIGLANASIQSVSITVHSPTTNPTLHKYDVTGAAPETLTSDSIHDVKGKRPRQNHLPEQVIDPWQQPSPQSYCTINDLHDFKGCTRPLVSLLQGTEPASVDVDGFI